MELPVELRLKIYDFAFQETIDSVVSPPFNTPKAGRSLRPPLKRLIEQRHLLNYTRCPRIVGSLALLHTSRTLRLETIDTFQWLVVVNYKAIEARAIAFNALTEEARFALLPKFLTAEQSIEREYLARLEVVEDQEVAREIAKLVFCAGTFELASGDKRRWLDGSMSGKKRKAVDFLESASKRRKIEE